jgi:hypothetical protein
MIHTRGIACNDRIITKKHVICTRKEAREKKHINRDQMQHQDRSSHEKHRALDDTQAHLQDAMRKSLNVSKLTVVSVLP